MIKKVWNRVVCVLVCIAIVFSNSTPGYASNKKKATLSDITSDTIKEKENQLSEAEALKTQLQSSVTDTKKVLEGLESTKNPALSGVIKIRILFRFFVFLFFSFSVIFRGIFKFFNAFT